VFVTGTFDDWGKTVKLDRVGDIFAKEVSLPAQQKIQYKVGARIFLCVSLWLWSPSIVPSFQASVIILWLARIDKPLR
jgi:hypothetical protein